MVVKPCYCILYTFLYTMLISPLLPSFLSMYDYCTLSLGRCPLCIVNNLRGVLSISDISSFVQSINAVELRKRDTPQVLIDSKRFPLLSFDSRPFLTCLRYSVLTFSFTFLVLCLQPQVFLDTCNSYLPLMSVF